MLFVSLILVSAPSIELTAVPPPVIAPSSISVTEDSANTAQQPAPPAAPVAPKWSGSVSVGISVTDGDSRLRSGSATADAEYRREHDRTTVGFWWNYQEDKYATPAVTQRRTGLKAAYNYFFSKRTYALVQGSIEDDKAAQIKSRTTIGVGVGQQFFENEAWIGPGTWKLAGEAGVAHVDEKHEVSSDDKKYVSARLAYNAEWKPNEKWDLTQTAEVFPSLEHKEDLLTKLDTRAKITLTEKMFAQLQWLWVFNNTPGNNLHRNNSVYALTVGWSF